MLETSLASIKVQIGRQLTKGLGAGSNPEVGRQAALEDRATIMDVLDGCVITSYSIHYTKLYDVPGATNRILGRFVDRICVTYQESMSVFPMEKTFLTGNPIRLKIMKGDRDSACRLFSLDKNLFTVFIFGGSSGAGSINRTMVDALNHLKDLREQIQFLHQTGDKVV